MKKSGDFRFQQNNHYMGTFQVPRKYGKRRAVTKNIRSPLGFHWCGQDLPYGLPPPTGIPPPPPGIPVGIMVGIPPPPPGIVVGIADGIILGIADGIMVGIADGIILGIEDGIIVGMADGIIVGMADGIIVGMADGIIVGIIDGDMGEPFWPSISLRNCIGSARPVSARVCTMSRYCAACSRLGSLGAILNAWVRAMLCVSIICKICSREA
jgi:hypothetical protein